VPRPPSPESPESTGYASRSNTGTLEHRQVEGEAVHRAILVVAGIGATMLLAACGNQTITASQTVSGVSVAIVVTSDSTAIGSLEAKLKSVAPGVTIANGDSHTGTRVCGFNVSKNGHTYQVDIFGPVPTTICNAQAQASFLQDAA
jgi:hypothetical protein